MSDELEAAILKELTSIRKFLYTRQSISEEEIDTAKQEQEFKRRV